MIFFNLSSFLLQSCRCVVIVVVSIVIYFKNILLVFFNFQSRKKVKKNCVIFLGMFSNVRRISSQSKKLSIISFQNHDTLFFIFNYMHDKYINKIVRLTRQIRFMCETNVGHFCARSIDWIQFSVYFHFSLIFQLIFVHSNRHLLWRTITTARKRSKNIKCVRSRFIFCRLLEIRKKEFRKFDRRHAKLN